MQMRTIARTALNWGTATLSHITPTSEPSGPGRTEGRRDEPTNPTIEEFPPGGLGEGRGAIVAIGLVCLLLITAIWVYGIGQIRERRSQAIESGLAENTNLAVAFEEHSKSILRSVERTLQLISDEYVRKAVRLNVQELIDGDLIDAGILNFAGIVDEQARPVLGNTGFDRAEFAAREYLEFHRQRGGSAVHIGQPVPGRTPNTWALPLSIRINKQDGSFGGIAYALLDPAGFTRLFRQINVGEQGLALLVGVDGITRAMHGGPAGISGENAPARHLLEEQAKYPSGTYSSAEGFDGVQRLFSYRTLAPHSLIVAVGTSQAERLAPLLAQERNYYGSAALTSAVILLYCGGLIFVRLTRRRSLEAVHSSAARYGAAFNQAAVGVARASLEGRLLDANGKFCGMLGYAQEELLKYRFSDITHPDDRIVTQDSMDRLVMGQAGGESPLLEKRLLRKDGTPVWITAAISTVRNTDGNPDYFMVTIEDITERKRAELSRKARGSCIDILIRSDNEVELAQKMCDNIVDNNGYLLAWVGIVEHDQHQTVRPIAYAGYPKDFIEQAQITWADNANGRGPAGTAVRTGKPQAVQDAWTDSAFRPWQGNAARLGYASVVALPLQCFDNVLGVLTIYSADVDAFHAADMQVLNELANDLAYCMAALRTRKAREQSERRALRSMEETILAMAETLETRDPCAAGRHRRVAGLATAIAREIGMPEDEIRALHLAAVVQDLGAIRIPARILGKPARLTRKEYELVKSHPTAGYDILKGVDSPWPIAQMVYQHHERLDGSGYPRGLKDAQILPGAKILAVADTVEAMASDRPYRAGCGIEKALAEIIDHRATRYDIAAVDACVKLFREQQFAFAA